jgi:hypothetical protein
LGKLIYYQSQKAAVCLVSDLIPEKSAPAKPYKRNQALKQPKALKFIPHDPVALAGDTLKFPAVPYGHVAARVVNQTRFMQYACR